MAYSNESIPTLGSKCACPQLFKHLAHGSLGPHGSKRVCNQTQLWTTLHMTSGDTTRRPVVGQGPQRSVGRPTNWVMPPGPASHRPKDLLEDQWDPLSSKWQVVRPICGPHLDSVHSHRCPHDEHMMEIPLIIWRFQGQFIQRCMLEVTRIADVALE